MFPKIGGKKPKWMVKIMENPIKLDDLGGFPIIFGNTHVFFLVGTPKDVGRFCGNVVEV